MMIKRVALRVPAIRRLYERLSASLGRAKILENTLQQSEVRVGESERKRARREVDIRALNEILSSNMAAILASCRTQSDEFCIEISERLLFVAANSGFRNEQVKNSVFDRAEKFGAHFMPVHFYSPIPQRDDIDRVESEVRTFDVPGVMPQANTVFEALEIYGQYADELALIPEERQDKLDFYWRNPALSPLDALGLYARIRHGRPAQVTEIGSGYSSLIAAKAIEKNGYGKLVCIEPYHNEMLDALSDKPIDLQIIESRVQDVGINWFNTLSTGDILFIDSSHVSKYGSDVNHEIFCIVPTLRRGVLVHVHDIFLPYDFDRAYINRKIFWNEQYVLAAFLAFNSDFSPIISHFPCGKDSSFAPALGALSIKIGRPVIGGGSYWFRRVKGESLS